MMGKKRELPVDKVNRLARELSVALDEWTDGKFMGLVLPASRSSGSPVMYANIDSLKRSMDDHAARAA